MRNPSSSTSATTAHWMKSYAWLMEMDYIPSFCTACYREGRTGDRFMSLCKSGQIQNCCHPNALMTLKEYLMDLRISGDKGNRG